MCFIFLINFIVGYNLESIFNTRLMNRFSKIFNSIFLTNDNAAFIYVKIVLFKRIVSREMIYFRYFVKNDMSRYSLLLKFSKKLHCCRIYNIMHLTECTVRAKRHYPSYAISKI